MDIDSLKATLGDETFAKLKVYVDDLTGQRDAAREESIKGRKGLKAQVEQLQALKTKLFDKLGIDEETDIDNLPDAKGQADALKQYETKLKRLEREAADKAKALDELQGLRRKDLQQLAVGKALRGQEFNDPEVAELLISSKVEWDGDDLFYKTDKGLVPLEDGVKLLTEQKPHLLKAAGTAGSGQRQQNNGATKTLPRSEFEALEPANKSQFIRDGGVLV